MASALPFRDINVHASLSHYVFTSPSSPSAPTLVVDRPTGDIRLNDGVLLGGKRVSSIAGILGMIKLRLDKYIIVITKAQPMGRIKGHMVFKVLATEFLPLRERPLHDLEEDAYINLIKSTIRSGPMYFSYSYDVTNSAQRQAQMDTSKPLWQRADDRFFWNRFVQSDLINFRRQGTRLQPGEQTGIDPYILPVMYGVMEIQPTSIKGKPLTIVLMTRRSRYRVGTRYFTRGIDEDGHVANYNETEQILLLNDGGNMRGRDEKGGETQVLSYVQTRGSVPLYWAQISTLKYSPKLQVKSVDSAIPAARKHFEEQIRIYGDNYLVNLVNQTGGEKRVKDAYEGVVKTLVSSPYEVQAQDEKTDELFHVVEPNRSKHQFDRLHYIYFDFHHETKGLKWYRAQLLLDQLKDPLDKQQYFRGVNMPVNLDGQIDIRNQQTSVVRTNCMDCLDRTNVIQSMLARRALNQQLIDTGILSQGELVSSDVAFEYIFRKIWADNADIVSKTYSGTGALKTDFTRTGNRTKAGAFQDFRNSIERYFKNNLLDGPRQDGFDLFLGAYIPDSMGSSGKGVFADRRPLLIQSIPYILFFSIFFVFLSVFSRRLPDAAVLPLRVFLFFWLVVGVWCFQFIFSNGMLYVNWPRLNPRPWATEGYQETINKLRKDKLIGQFVVRHERGLSMSRYTNAEEGKKRIE